MKIARTALVVPFLLLAVACGGSGQDDATPAADRQVLTEPGAAPAAPQDESAYLADPAAGGSAEKARDTDGGAVAASVRARSVISKGQVSLESEDLDQTRFELQKLLAAWDGTIANEESSADDEGRTDHQQLQLRVPVKHFGAAMDEISRLGKLVDRSRSSEDVTTQVIDLDARVRSQRVSVARIQALMAQADTLSEVISIESQLSRRQAELDSLEQQQKYLADQTAESTITVFLELAGGEEVEDDEAGGFVGGLRDGWDAFGTATQGLLQGLGAVLPFGVALAIVGVPVGLAVRRRRALT